MEQFPHLKFKHRISGLPRFHAGGVQDPRTLENKENRQEHGNFLHTGTSKIKSDWEETLKQRDKTGFTQIDESTVPVFLQINPDIISPDFNLESYGIEIIAEVEDGYIIGASQDKLRTLEEKIAGFITAEHGTGKIADFWQIIDGKREEWKPRHILSEFLYSKWNEIADDEFYRVEVSVAFSKPIGKEPDPNKVGGKKRRHRYEEKLIERDELLMQRQNHFDQFIMHYGKRVSSFIELEDSFACEVEINGLGLKDLVVNYQYVFEVSEIDEIFGIEGHESNLEEFELELISPDDDSVEVGVIDSGIMENHKYLAPGIKSENSKSYTGDKSTADYVQGGGHGTKVAGAIFYPRGVNEIESPYKLPCFIRNLKVLNEHNKLHHNYPAKLIQQVIEDNDECMIFNLSLCSELPCRIKHMSTWAAIIDKLSFENNILFIISAGNIRFPVIRGFLSGQVNYPDYLEEGNCRIANPAQSLFSLTVGSINPSGYEDEFWKSLGVEDEISAFSRIGPGIWDSVKPDVVEYGGGVVLSKDGLHLIREHEVTSPELVRSTMHGGSAIGRDSVGTSFSAPKIAHIAAVLKHLYPDDHINLIKALVAQGARLPGEFFLNPTKRSMQYFGYGLPLLNRVSGNTEQRVTFYNTGEIQAEEAQIFLLKIPDEFRNPGDDNDFLIEVTLAYTAQVRRTRQRTKSYLSTWLDWETSKIDESFEEFQDYILKKPDEKELPYDSDYRNELNTIQWKIRNRSDHGMVKDFRRSNSTLQKDWATLKSYDLPEEISFAVRGHKGWDKNKVELPYALVVSIEVLGTDLPVYESIRIENEVEIEI